MSVSRSAILAAVAAAARARRASGTTKVVTAHIRPARAEGGGDTLIARFGEMAAFAGATVDRVSGMAAAPAAVAAFVAREGLGDALVLSPGDRIAALPWADCPGIAVRAGAPGPDDRVSVTGAVAGIAETGTVLVRSGSDIANRLHLLPEAHVVVLPSSAIVGSYEDALARLGASGPLPRAATFITGPSRTADIERTPQIGVHGPRRLHIVVTDGA